MPQGLRRCAGHLAAAVFLAGVFAMPHQALSQSVKKDLLSSPAGAAGLLSNAAVEVDGFRGAKFGMTQAEVKHAIFEDFKLKGDAIRKERNPGERTKALLVKVPNLLPGGGIAQISYIFGYRTKKLIQVTVSWSKATDKKMTPARLFANSSVLRDHFTSEKFKSGTVATNIPVKDGLLVFRGSDAEGRTTILMLEGAFRKGKGKQRVLTPDDLLLFYVANAKKPDIYRLPPHSF